MLQRAIVSEGGSAMLRGDFVRVHSALLVFNMADNQFPHKLLQVLWCQVVFFLSPGGLDSPPATVNSLSLSIRCQC